MTSTSVLIVEDESLIADGLRRTLTRLGYAVSAIVSTGREAIERAKADRPDVVLMDVTLSGEMDGLEAARFIREQSGAAVVFVTAHADTGTLERIALGRPQGYQGYIVKPFSEEELQRTLAKVLQPAG